MSVINDPLSWVERAEEDFAVVRSSLRHKIPLVYAATFHAQQGAEKYFKAILVWRKQPFPRTHDLIALSDLCQAGGILIPVNPDDLDRLSAYAIEVRYPGTQPTLQEAKEAIQIAKSVRRFVRNLLGL